MNGTSWEPSLSSWLPEEDDTYFLERDVPQTRYRRRKAARRAWQTDFLADVALPAMRPRPAPKLEPIRLAAPSRIIFCDFDGVLNDSPHGAYGLKRPQVARLDALATELDAKVVVSSWWRWQGVERCANDLADAGFSGDVIGVTPWLGETAAWDHRVRGVEVQAVVKALGDLITGMVILDDHDRMASVLPWLIQTDSYTGLTDADAMLAAAKLLERTPAF